MGRIREQRDMQEKRSENMKRNWALLQMQLKTFIEYIEIKK